MCIVLSKAHYDSTPPPRVHPPRRGTVTATVSYCTGLQNYESSLLELMRTSFVLTHCTPETSQMFPEGTIVHYARSTKEPVLAVQGPSPHGDRYRTITYKHGATEVVHDPETFDSRVGHLTTPTSRRDPCATGRGVAPQRCTAVAVHSACLLSAARLAP